MFLVFSFFLPGELCQSRCFSSMFQSTFSKDTIPCVLGKRNTYSNYITVSFSAPHCKECLSVPSLQSIAPQTLPSHTWNVGVRNKCFKNTHVCQCSAYKMPNHYKIIRQALCRWLKACPHQATVGTAGTPKAALIQPVVLRSSAPECCVPCHTSQWTDELEHSTAMVQPKCVFEPVSPS